MKHGPTLLQWILIFVITTWLSSLVCAGVAISILSWLLRHSVRVVVPAILIAFLVGQPSQAYLSTYDSAGNVTLMLQTSVDMQTWVDSPFRAVMHVNPRTMAGSSVLVYSNAVALAEIFLEPPTADGRQLIDLRSCIRRGDLGVPSGFVRWRVPSHELSFIPNLAGEQSLIVVLVCGVAVIVVSGIAVVQIVKLCNRIDMGTNAPGTNAPKVYAEAP